MSSMDGGHEHECQFCGKRVYWRRRRAVCRRHAPKAAAGKEMWVEFWGTEDWASQSVCVEEEGCGVEAEPNGGFICIECYVDSKHSPELVS